MYKIAIKDGLDDLLLKFNPDEIWCRDLFLGAGILKSNYKGVVKQIFSTSARLNVQGEFFNNKGMRLSKRIALFVLAPFVYICFLAIEKILLKKTIPVVFSENMKRQLNNTHGNLADNVAVIKPGVDADFFSPKRSDEVVDHLANQFGLNRDEDYILYVGRLSRAKNIPFLIDAYYLIKDRAKLIIVGDGGDRRWIEDYIKRIGLVERVIFAGTQYELLPGFYRIAKVSVLPTTSESFGQVLVESLACGTPVVGIGNTNTATAEIIEDGITGKVVTEISVQSFANAITDILNLDDSSYEDMRSCCRDSVLRNFQWENFVKKVLALPDRK
jgi:glycosyltransferase involved in cell wall biosynthesis